MNRRNALLSVAGAGLAGTYATAAASKPGPARTPARRQVIARDGTHLFHRDWGDGKPVVFMAGWTLTSETWAYQAADLSDRGLRCIAYDRRGHGRSEDPGRGYDIDTLADDLAAVLDTLDLRDVTLVGHSMASGEMTRYLTRHGSARVSRLLYLAPTTPFLLKTADNPMGLPGAFFDKVRQVWKTDFNKWADDNTAPFFLPDTSPSMIEWLKSSARHCSLRAVVDCNKAMVENDFRAELAAIRLPTLVIQGDKDASAPLELTGKRTAELVPGARLKVYPGAPHGLFITHMAQLNADILAFAQA
jgi:non-heme chloroperoxidase